MVSRPPGIHWRLSPSQEAPGACSQGSGDGAPSPQSPKFSWIIGNRVGEGVRVGVGRGLLVGGRGECVGVWGGWRRGLLVGEGVG